MIIKLSVVLSKVIQDTFNGTADVAKFKSSGFTLELSFKKAMITTTEDHLLEMHKTIINEWQDAAFPIGVKDDGTAHKEALRTLLFAPDITRILAGFTPTDIDKWITHPWLMPVLQLWHNILMKYESIAENINS
eukprot:1951491-Rhodomonas_salina.1